MFSPRTIADGLFVAPADVKFYGARIQTRMTVARLASGELWVHSPVVLDDALREWLDALGPVAHVVSPNKIHHQGLASFVDAYPDATLYASPGLPERRPDLTFAAVLGDAPEAAWSADLDQALTAGNVFFSEVVFLHRRSKTLIVADLVETIAADTVFPFNRVWARAFGVYGRPRPSPEFRAYTDDVDAARRAFERILEWDFERIVLAHGDLVLADAKATLERVVQFLLDEVAARPRWRQGLYNAVAARQ